ncbi:MAG: 3-deoxy-manno-octulosonate cytidylyltransferase, partial [Paracoccaceae bacterium]|nr:3-deoxy-manno-octulosonate cytidylyltransferase [Paracoccaceae bacterium]
MKTIIIIPARFASSRYPGKPLVELKLPNGEQRSLIELTWRAAGKVNDIHDIFIATDDTRIATAVRAFGAKVIMTSSQCRNGTERCAEAVDNAKLDADLIINF